jgi:hypothetical protein
MFTVVTRSLAPKNLGVTGDNFGNTLTWQDPSIYESQFVVERAEGSSNFQILATLEQNIVTYLDHTIKKGLTYHYRVMVVNPGGNSEYSNVVDFTSDVFVGVETKTIAGLEVYPNPVKNKLLIKFGDQHQPGYEVSLHDLQGKTIFSSPVIRSGETELSMGELPAGLYLLQIKGTREKEIRLISKQ